MTVLSYTSAITFLYISNHFRLYWNSTNMMQVDMECFSIAISLDTFVHGDTSCVPMSVIIDTILQICTTQAAHLTLARIVCPYLTFNKRQEWNDFTSIMNIIWNAISVKGCISLCFLVTIHIPNCGGYKRNWKTLAGTFIFFFV